MREFTFCDDGEKGALVEFHVSDMLEGEADELFRELWGAWKDDPRVRFTVLSGEDIAGRFQGSYQEAAAFLDQLCNLGFIPAE
jgi:hypothetical protein